MSGRPPGMPTLPWRSTAPSRARRSRTLAPRRTVTPRMTGLPMPAKTLRPTSTGLPFRKSPANGRSHRWSGSSGVNQLSTNRTGTSAPMQLGQHVVNQHNQRSDRAPTQPAISEALSVTSRVSHLASSLIARVFSRPPRVTESTMQTVEKSAGSPRPSSTSAKPAASRERCHQVAKDGPSWFGGHGTLEDLLKPFAKTAIGSLGGGVLTSLLINHLWPQRKVDPVEEAPQPEPQPKKIEPPSFTAHLRGWDHALISIGDARRNNIPKKPLLPIR